MLEETQSLLDSNGSENEINNKIINEIIDDNSNQKEHQGFFSSIRYYLRQPKIWDWVMVGLIICAIIATIIVVA